MLCLEASQVQPAQTNCVPGTNQLGGMWYQNVGKMREKKLKQNQKARIVNFGWTKEKLELPAVRHQTCPKKTDPSNWVERKLNAVFAGCTATRYGQSAEPLARKWFEGIVRADS